MKKFLLDILVDPQTGNKIMYDDITKELYSGNHENTYSIIDDVPVMMIKETDTVTSQLHRHLHSSFNYADHYKKDAEVFDYFNSNEINATKKEIQRLHEAIINLVPENAQLILDAGCGNGWVAGYFLKKGKKVISMDISTINPVEVSQNNPVENHAALVADVFHLPFKNDSFDCIIASEIMEHVYDPKLFVSKLTEKLKPGGKLIVTTPYNEKIEYYVCVHCNKPTPKNAHLHSFNKKNISDVIADDNTTFSARTFANKYLIKTRINVLLSFLPFGFWKIIDATANTFFNSPTRFIIDIVKK